MTFSTPWSFWYLVVTIAYTFDEAEAACGPLLLRIEAATVAFFAVDCALRIWTAKYHHPNLKEWKAVCRYIFSFSGIVDLLSFLPYYMPFFFPSGAVAFRMFRVVRIFRLFRINAYYDSLNVITQVLTSKAQQLLSSVFIILVLMTASSLCMYSLEHDAQPQVFSNAFADGGLRRYLPHHHPWQDLRHPDHLPGRGHGGDPHRYHFCRLRGPVFPHQADQRIRHGGGHSLHPHPPDPRDRWANAPLRDLGLPEGVIIAAVQRGRDIIVPRGDVVLLPGDNLVLGAGVYEDDVRIQLKEIVLQTHHPWVGHPLRDLDISRQTVIIMVRRRNRTLIPNGGLKLLAGDKVLLYTQSHLPHAQDIQI